MQANYRDEMSSMLQVLPGYDAAAVPAALLPL